MADRHTGSALARDRVPVRGMKADDLRALVSIDRRIVGRDRSAYFERKLADGTFALQGHDPGSTVRYRNIRVKRLD